MSDPFIVRGRPVNPLPDDQQKPVPLNQTGEDFLREGYSVLARADRLNPYQSTIPRGAPVFDDGPNVAYDEE